MDATTIGEDRRPIWMDTRLPDAGPLRADARCDVCVVGGGLAGLLIAERLAGAGLSVVLLEQGRPAEGETGHTTAHFVTALDDRLSVLERLHGERGARLAAESHRAAIDHVEALAARLGAACGWSRLDGYLTVGPRHKSRREELLGDELAACGRAGMEVERVVSLPAPWPGDLGPALRFPRQAQAHPLRLLRAVAEHLMASGVKLHGGTRATEIHGGAQAAVVTEAGPVVRCGHIVVATNTPINNLVAVHTKQAGYQTYVMAFGIPGGALPPILLWDGLWEDDAAYHYVRLMHARAGEGGAGQFLIVGGEDHKTGQGPAGDAPYVALEGWTRAHFPMCGGVARRWSGEVMEPADGLGYIGRNAVGRGNVYIVTGDSGNGMTHGAIAAMLIPDLIAGKENRWATLYDPARKVGVHAMADFLRENVNTLRQYGDWLRRGDVTDESQIAPGEGGVLARGLKHLAVYRDEQGRFTRLNARCPHLGGVVQWNTQEKTWDCPCHASRFEARGRVIHGPANGDLKAEGAG
ncbi:Gamma-glutamylputrescine oxidoreductase [Phycisphaerales bacterium]|nr:Gamma-glutamylputrescine oxidoreductase [Phycisphaerales bacterium]